MNERFNAWCTQWNSKFKVGYDWMVMDSQALGNEVHRYRSGGREKKKDFEKGSEITNWMKTVKSSLRMLPFTNDGSS